MSSSNPLQRGSRGCGMFIHQNHAAGGENGSIMVGMFVCLCLVSQKPPSESFLFPPERTKVLSLLMYIYFYVKYLHTYPRALLRKFKGICWFSDPWMPFNLSATLSGILKPCPGGKLFMLCTIFGIFPNSQNLRCTKRCFFTTHESINDYATCQKEGGEVPHGGVRIID